MNGEPRDVRITCHKDHDHFVRTQPVNCWKGQISGLGRPPGQRVTDRTICTTVTSCQPLNGSPRCVRITCHKDHDHFVRTQPVNCWKGQISGLGRPPGQKMTDRTISTTVTSCQPLNGSPRCVRITCHKDHDHFVRTQPVNCWQGQISGLGRPPGQNVTDRTICTTVTSCQPLNGSPRCVRITCHKDHDHFVRTQPVNCWKGQISGLGRPPGQNVTDRTISTIVTSCQPLNG